MWVLLNNMRNCKLPSIESENNLSVKIKLIIFDYVKCPCNIKRYFKTRIHSYIS